jgi:hypothetical protein
MEPVCLADEADGLVLLQSGLALVQPLRSRVLSLLQTSGPDAPDPARDADPPRADAAAVGGDHEDRSAVTIVMPPKASREGLVLATNTQNSTQRQIETEFDGQEKAYDEVPMQMDDHEDHADPKNGDGISEDNHEDQEDISSEIVHHPKIGDEISNDDHEDQDDTSSKQVSNNARAKKEHNSEIIEIPSDKCQRPCENGICHDGECFCRYPYVGLQCDILAISEIGKVLAATMLMGIGLFTALCVFVVWKANQKHSPAAPVQEPHMADEEWLPPPPIDPS